MHKKQHWLPLIGGFIIGGGLLILHETNQFTGFWLEGFPILGASLVLILLGGVLSLLTLEAASREAEEKLHQELQKAIISDGETGLFNKTFMIKMLRREIAHASRYKTPVSVMLVSINDYADIAKTFGSIEATKALTQISKNLYGAVRQTDLILDSESLGRYSGSTFIMVLPQTVIHGAALCAKRIKDTVEKKPVITRTHTVEPTVSIGFTQHGVNDDLQSTLARADKALSKAKSGGRREEDSIIGLHPDESPPPVE